MRNLTAAFVALLTVAATAGAASADTSAFNKYTTTNQYNGYSETNVDAHVSTESKTITESSTLKVESIADLGDTNVANVKVTGSIDGDVKFSATSHSSNNRPVDPVATVYVTEVNQLNVSTTSESADISTFSSFEFDSTTYEHEVGNRF